MVIRRIQIEIVENVDQFPQVMARIYETTVEGVLRDRLFYNLRANNVANTWETWLDPEDILRRCGLIESYPQEQETAIKHNTTPVTQLSDRNTIIQELERVTDHTSLCLQSKAFEELLEENPPLKRTSYSAQQALIELKQRIEESGDMVTLNLPADIGEILEKEAQKRSKSASETLTEIILNYLREVKAE